MTAPYHPVLMVASTLEWQQARSAGWDSRDIIGISALQLEGRRYKSLTMTWSAFEAVIGKPEILDRLETNAILMHAETKIDTIKAPPEPVAQMEIQNLQAIAEGRKVSWSNKATD